MQQQPPVVQAAGNIDPKDRYKEGNPGEYEGEAGKVDLVPPFEIHADDDEWDKWDNSTTTRTYH